MAAFAWIKALERLVSKPWPSPMASSATPDAGIAKPAGEAASPMAGGPSPGPAMAQAALKAPRTGHRAYYRSMFGDRGFHEAFAEIEMSRDKRLGQRIDAAQRARRLDEARRKDKFKGADDRAREEHGEIASAAASPPHAEDGARPAPKPRL